MIEIVAALAPVFAIILLGFVFKRRRIVPDAFWHPAETVTFYLFFPSLLVWTTATSSFAGLDLVPMAVALVAGILLVEASTFLLRAPLALDGPGFTSLVQGVVRPNVYVGIAAASALFGAEGLAAVSLCVALAVPLVNGLAVVALVRWGGDGGTPVDWRRTILPIAKNPLILACALGLTLNATGLGLPPVVAPVLEILGRASLPIALLAVGAGLDLGAVGRAGRAVAAIVAIKLLGLPAITFVLLFALGVDGVAAAVAMLYASLPGSASAYVMARQMGGDAEIMAGVITATTIAAAITMPLVLLSFV